MYMFPLFLFILLIEARTISTYHPHLLFKKYIVIKSKTLSKVLIGQSDPVAIRTKNAKANRNKLTYAGIIFYSLFLLLICLTIIMVLLPDFPCETFIYDSRYMVFAGNTLNKKLLITLSFTLFFSEFSFEFINTSKYAIEKTTAKRLVRTLYYLLATMASIGAIGGLWKTITTILEMIRKA